MISTETVFANFFLKGKLMTITKLIFFFCFPFLFSLKCYLKLNINLVILGFLGPVWYMCLKTENCCLKIFVEIRVGEKVHKNT